MYQYHPLFREFLQARARQAYSREQTRELLRRGGEILEKEGQVADAAELYRLSGEWNSFIRVVLANARLMVSQGRNRSLEAWLTVVPEDVIDSDPWLLYWMGVCRMPFNLPEGRRYFEKAFELFRWRRDASGIFLSWSGVAETIIQEMGVLSRMDPWIAMLDELMKEYPVFPSPQIEGHVTSRIFMSLSLRQPWHPAFDRWKEKAMALFTSEADASLRLLTGFYLLQHLILVGDQPRCEQVMVTIRRLTGTEEVSPLAYTMGKMADAWLAWATCNCEQALKSMNEGLEKSRATGVHIWDYLLLHMGVIAVDEIGNRPLAEELVRKMESALERGRPLDKCYYYENAGWLRMLNGDMQGAMLLSTTGLEMVTKIGFLGAEVRGRLAQAHYLRAMGKYKEAKEHLARALEIGRKMKGPLIMFYCWLKAADIAFAEGEKKTAFRFLRDAMALGREKGYAAFILTHWLPKEMSFLCMKALEAGVEPDFAAAMIRKRKLVPETPPLHLENWPWPLKIFTLGRFELMRDDKPVRFSGKIQKKPLDMLKALISFNGQAGDGQLIDALWPDAEGDAGRQLFRTTLHRLRQLIGNDNALSFKDGTLNLDPRYCWTDAWAFERMLENAERPSPRIPSPGGEGKRTRGKYEKLQRLRKALSLYRGHYLADDLDKQWALSLRERLKGKFVQAVSDLCKVLESRKEWKKAIEIYERGIEVDDLAEELYQRLMECHLKLGKRSTAVRVYDRCRKMFATRLGVEISDETKLLYKKIVGSHSTGSP